MRSNIDMIKAERKKTIDAEHDYRMNQKPITYFPYTHGDTVDAARLQIREEMQNDLKNRIALIESTERAKLGEEKYEKLHGLQQSRVTSKHPQGTIKQEHLYESFQYDPPFYLKENKPVFIRKTNPAAYDSALEMARGRFEAKL